MTTIARKVNIIQRVNTAFLCVCVCTPASSSLLTGSGGGFEIFRVSEFHEQKKNFKNEKSTLLLSLSFHHLSPKRQNVPM